jgi:hypothetical protein
MPPPGRSIVPRGFFFSGLAVVASVFTASAATAQSSPQPLPPPTVYDWGPTTTAFGRVGYASGYRVGTSLALSYRTTTWPYRSSFGMDALEVALFTNLDRAEMGGRLSPFNLFWSFWSDSVFQGGYARWNLIDIGVAYRPDGASSAEVGSAFSVGYSYELSDGVALRVAEVGAFAGLYALTRGEDPKLFFDFGAMLSTGITFR